MRQHFATHQQRRKKLETHELETHELETRNTRIGNITCIGVHFKLTRFYCLTLILAEGEANGW
jgi:hypothetical protein